MGARGPVPKSERLKLLQGNPGKRPFKKARAPSAAKVTCPEWLSPGAKAEWRRVAPELQRLGLLTPLDRSTFAAYCQSYAQWSEFTRFLREHGEQYMSPNGRILERPEVRLAQQAGQLMRAFASEFGLTPNSRTRLNVEDQVIDEDDEFARFLSRAKR